MTLKHPHTCSIAGCPVTWWTGGLAGRGGVAPLCPKHYHRQRRGSPIAKVATRPPEALNPVTMDLIRSVQELGWAVATRSFHAGDDDARGEEVRRLNRAAKLLKSIGHEPVWAP